MNNSLCFKTIVKTLFLTMIVMFLFISPELRAQQNDYNCTCATCGKSCSEIRNSGHRPGYSCYNEGNSSSGSSINPVDFSFTNPISSGVQVGLLSSIAGGLLVKGKSGEELWLEGAAFGFGIGSSIALFNTLNKRSLVANMALAAVSGAANGLAAAKLEKAFAEPTEPPKPDNTVKYVLIGAAAETALVTTISLAKKPKGGYSYRMNKHNFLSKMNVNLYGNRLELLVNL